VGITKKHNLAPSEQINTAESPTHHYQCHTAITVCYDEQTNHVNLETFSEIRDLLSQVGAILEKGGVLSPYLLHPVSLEARVTFLATLTTSLNHTPSLVSCAQQPSNDDPDQPDPREFGLL